MGKEKTPIGEYGLNALGDDPEGYTFGLQSMG
jgi:predicted enzyme related to lactoylglutathione lyase